MGRKIEEDEFTRAVLSCQETSGEVIFNVCHFEGNYHIFSCN